MKRLTSRGCRVGLTGAGLLAGCAVLVVGGTGIRSASAQGALGNPFGGPQAQFQGGGQLFQGGNGQGVPGGQGLFQQGGRQPRVIGTQNQGGAFSSNTSMPVAPGRIAQLTAFCTDLLSDPPNAQTRFRGGDRALVTLADGRSMTLASALENGVVGLRGRNETLNPLRSGGLALTLELVNTAPVPVRIQIPAGEAVTPAGQAAQPLPAGSDRLFAAAAAEGLEGSNTVQYAVWAARGSTAEDVEQANMMQLPRQELTRVQQLLQESGISRKFDRERGAGASRFAAAAKELGEEALPVEGATTFPGGAKAEVEGVRAADGSGVLKVSPERGGEFYYRADFKPRKDGRLDVTLRHLTTGRRIQPYRGYVIVRPAPGAVG
ncbi:MAG: hypothetical protein K0Q72_2149 [Armatimonadetes bacterium]|jgi:hypothetical protein|nr:hypothetical protein [Armatimonadota bacterium]